MENDFNIPAISFTFHVGITSFGLKVPGDGKFIASSWNSYGYYVFLLRKKPKYQQM